MDEEKKFWSNGFDELQHPLQTLSSHDPCTNSGPWVTPDAWACVGAEWMMCPETWEQPYKQWSPPSVAVYMAWEIDRHRSAHGLCTMELLADFCVVLRWQPHAALMYGVTASMRLCIAQCRVMSCVLLLDNQQLSCSLCLCMPMQSVSVGFRPPIDPFLPDYMQKLITDCWAQNPTDRPSMKAGEHMQRRVHTHHST
jgi:hypothetical protein